MLVTKSIQMLDMGQSSLSANRATLSGLWTTRFRRHYSHGQPGGFDFKCEPCVFVLRVGARNGALLRMHAGGQTWFDALHKFLRLGICTVRWNDVFSIGLYAGIKDAQAGR